MIFERYPRDRDVWTASNAMCSESGGHVGMYRDKWIVYVLDGKAWLFGSELKMLVADWFEFCEFTRRVDGGAMYRWTVSSLPVAHPVY